MGNLYNAQINSFKNSIRETLVEFTINPEAREISDFFAEIRRLQGYYRGRWEEIIYTNFNKLRKRLLAENLTRPPTGKTPYQILNTDDFNKFFTDVVNKKRVEFAEYWKKETSQVIDSARLTLSLRRRKFVSKELATTIKAAKDSFTTYVPRHKWDDVAEKIRKIPELLDFIREKFGAEKEAAPEPKIQEKLWNYVTWTDAENINVYGWYTSNVKYKERKPHTDISVDDVLKIVTAYNDKRGPPMTNNFYAPDEKNNVLSSTDFKFTTVEDVYPTRELNFGALYAQQYNGQFLPERTVNTLLKYRSIRKLFPRPKCDAKLLKRLYAKDVYDIDDKSRPRVGSVIAAYTRATNDYKFKYYYADDGAPYDDKLKHMLLHIPIRDLPLRDILRAKITLGQIVNIQLLKARYLARIKLPETSAMLALPFLTRIIAFTGSAENVSKGSWIPSAAETDYGALFTTFEPDVGDRYWKYYDEFEDVKTVEKAQEIVNKLLNEPSTTVEVEDERVDEAKAAERTGDTKRKVARGVADNVQRLLRVPTNLYDLGTKTDVLRNVSYPDILPADSKRFYEITLGFVLNAFTRGSIERLVRQLLKLETRVYSEYLVRDPWTLDTYARRMKDGGEKSRVYTEAISLIRYVKKAAKQYWYWRMEGVTRRISGNSRPGAANIQNNARTQTV